MSVAINLASGFVECLLLVLAFEAARHARPIYWVAFTGLVLVLYARMSEGIISDGVQVGGASLTFTGLLTLAGLVLAGLTVLADLLFEVVPEGESEPGPPV